MNIRTPLLIVVTAAATVSAQPHPGGVLVGGGYPIPAAYTMNGLFRVDRFTGTLTTIVDTTNPPRPNWILHGQPGMDNSSLVFGCLGAQASTLYGLADGIFRHDPGTRTYTTLAHSPIDFLRVDGMVGDQDGDWLVTSLGLQGLSTKSALYRVSDSGRGWTTILSTLRLGQRQYLHHVATDVDTGDLLVSTGVSPRPIYALTRGGALSTWHLSSRASGLSFLHWVQDVETGDLLSMISGSRVVRLSKGNADPPIIPVAGIWPESAHDIAFENQSLARPLVVTYAHQRTSSLTTARLHYLDPARNFAVVRSLTFAKGNQAARTPYLLTSIANESDRYVQTIRRAQRVWDLRLAFPGRNGRGYVVAAGLSGIRPGLRLPDGRHVWLNLDALVPLVVGNKIPAVFAPGPGVLDHRGRATGRIDVSRLGLPPGLTVHVVVLVLDPAAPQGIAFITEPVPLQL
jgi:hypothetical protein